MHASIVPVADLADVYRLIDRLRALGREHGEPAAHPVLNELRAAAFRGAAVLVRHVNGRPAGICAARIGSKARGGWGPYLNWQAVYVLPGFSRSGHGVALYRHAETAALAAGCVRVKAWASSTGSARMHLALGHRFWGLRPGARSLLVDSPLPGRPDRAGPPPGATRPNPMTAPEVLAVAAEGLAYDRSRAAAAR